MASNMADNCFKKKIVLTYFSTILGQSSSSVDLSQLSDQLHQQQFYTIEQAMNLLNQGEGSNSGGQEVRPKLKLSLFALYRPTRKYPADSKDFIGKKVFLFFLLVTTVHRVTFIVYLPRQLQKSCKKHGNQCYF